MHTIRLRHPWQCESDGDATLWSRKFNWPAELLESETVRLVVEPCDGLASVVLNDEPLRFDERGRADITAAVRMHNRLVFRCAEVPPPGQAFPFDVRLEISDDDANGDATNE